MSDEELKNDDGENTPSGTFENETFESTADITSIKNAKGSKGGPPWLDRKKILMAVAGVFAVVVMIGVITSTGKSRKTQEEQSVGYSARPPTDMLNREMARALRTPEEIEELLEYQDDWGLPSVESVTIEEFPPPIMYSYPPPNYPPPQGGGYNGGSRESQPHLSSLIPNMEGSLFGTSFQPPPTMPSQNGNSQPPYDPMAQIMQSMPNFANMPGLVGGADPYATQNNQANKQEFYNSSLGGAIVGSQLYGDLLWIGTIIPAVLETSINTDLPGNVVARVTQNIYDSLTGKDLLIPQGTILVAQYNSSVSYSQHRVQIVWDVLIRPDGYYLQLEGMNAVDARGMAGIKAKYDEHWFEYIKAAGIITTFSLVNAKMTEQIVKYGSEEMAVGAIASNAEFIRDLGGNLISKALNIQPTLTVDNGERINIMLNKNLYLPPFSNYQVTQRYTLP